MDTGAWWATVHGSQRVGHDFTFAFIFIYMCVCVCVYIYIYYIYTHTYLLSVLGTLKETEKAQEMKKNKQWGYKDTTVQKETSRKSLEMV